MNTYSKFCPNVFLAKCEEEHEKDDMIMVTTRHGKENECIVFNLIGKNGIHFFYSIVRADGYNAQTRAGNKADKYMKYSDNAGKRSDSFYKRSDLSEGKTGIPLGQPILVGHHSENKHRKTIERANNNMSKCVEESKKSEEYAEKSKYWERRKNDINLSMPESLEYFKFELEKAEKYHRDLKDGKAERIHSYSLTYAKKAVNDMKKKYETACRLWL